MTSTSHQEKFPVHNLDTLRRNHSYLVRELTPKTLFDNKLGMILTDKEKDEIDNLEGRREKMEKMMKIIYNKTEDNVYIKFLDWLKESKYDHVVTKLTSTNVSSPCDIEMLKGDVKTLQHDVVKLQQQQPQPQQQLQKQQQHQQMESKLINGEVVFDVNQKVEPSLISHYF